MTRTLILMRHAKSSWGDPDLDDIDRPLNDRGSRDAPRVGRWLRDTGYIPDVAYCSPARRARETVEGLGLKLVPETVVDLYMAAPEALLTVIRSAGDQTILIVAHNPGIGALAGQLVEKAPDHDRFRDYPTSATLVVEFHAEDWGEVQPGRGIVRSFITPRDLPG